MPFKTSFSFPTFRTLSAIFFVLALLVLVMVTVSTAGSVEVQVKPSLSTRVVDSFFTLTSSVTPNSGELHSEFKQTTLEARVSIESPESSVRPEKARYAIVIHNQYSRDQALVRTTRFLFNDVLYRLVDPVNVKAGTSLSAIVEADKAGGGFTRSKGEKLTIPGLWTGVQPYIFGIVESELRPGFVTVKTATQAQIDAALIQAFRVIDLNRKEVIESDPSMYVFHQEEEPVKIAPEPGEITESDVVVTQRMGYIALTQSSLEGSLRDSLSSVEPDKKFFYEPSDVTFEVLDWKQDSARLRVSIPVRFYTPLAQDQFYVSDFRGKSEAEISTLLNDTYGVADSAVNYTPVWLKPLLSRFGTVNVTVLEP